MDRATEFEGTLQQVYSVSNQVAKLGLRLLWHCLHLIITMWYFVAHVSHVLESYAISAGVLKSYQALNIHKLHYLAIVVESEDAFDIPKVVQLMQQLADIGVKHVCLYDKEGILKMSMGYILGKLKNAKLFEHTDENESLTGDQLMTLEFASISDGKEAVAKAANSLFQKYVKLGVFNQEQQDQFLTESHVTEALKAVGVLYFVKLLDVMNDFFFETYPRSYLELNFSKCQVTKFQQMSGHWAPDPDLLLVYGPARCHLGFPAWRIRYTEIVHMGPLKSMKHGSLIKAIYKFTMVRQNLGT